MGAFQINQILATLNIFDGDSWANMFKGLGAFIGRVVYAVIIVALARIADVCQMVFKKLAGIGSGVRLGNQTVEGDIVLAFLNEKIIQHVFFALLILAVVILLITTFVATIKTEFNKDGNNNKRIVIKNAFRGLANFVLVPIICIFGLFVGNALLRALDGATNPSGTQTTLSSQIFLAGGYNANRARNSENNKPDATKPYINGSFGALLTGNGYGGAGVGNFGIFFDDDPNSLNPYRAADKIDEVFSRGLYIKAGEGVGTVTQNMGFVALGVAEEYGAIGNKLGLEISVDSNTLSYSAAKIWYGGFFTSDIKIGSLIMQSNNGSVGYGDYGIAAMSYQTVGNGVFRFKEGDVIPFSLYNIGLVYYYYNTNLGGFSYLISAIALIFCGYVLIVSALGLVKRLFYLTMLFVISAPVCATYPLDNGDILKRWRTEFIKNALSAYSVVVVLNLFLVILPLIIKIKLFVSSDFLIPGIGAAFANYISRILMVIGALMFFKDAVAKLAEIIGAGDVNGDGNKNAKDVGRKAAVGAGLAIGAGALIAGKAKETGKKAGQGISNKWSAHQDKRFEKKYNNELKDKIAKDDAAKAVTGNGKSGSGNSMNFTPAGNYYEAALPDAGYKSSNANTQDIPNSSDIESKATDNSVNSSDTTNSLNSHNNSDNRTTDGAVGEVEKVSRLNTIVKDKEGKTDWHASRMNYKKRRSDERRWDKLKGTDEQKMNQWRKMQELDPEKKKLREQRSVAFKNNATGIIKGTGRTISNLAKGIHGFALGGKNPGYQTGKGDIEKISKDIKSLKDEQKKYKEEIKEQKRKVQAQSDELKDFLDKINKNKKN